MKLKSISRLLIVLLSLFSFTLRVFAEADDITMVGNNQAVYSLDTALSQTVITSQKEQVTLEVNDVVVEPERILVRFFIWDLPLDWGEKVSSSSRLYGDYLPIAELGTPNGTWLTPSSASRYSLIANDSTLVIAGLLVFLTDEAPEIVSFNFNQIPFDEQPLSEGAVIKLKLSPGDTQQRNSLSPTSSIANGVEFTLLSTAQTPDLSMLQPCVRMLRGNESLTQFGWITINRTDGKQYAINRGSVYGFNLADDSLYSAAHAYTFVAMDSEQPLKVSLDYVYAQRAVEDRVILPLISPDKTLNIPLVWEDYQATITSYAFSPVTTDPQEHTRLRLFIDADKRISNIDFYLPDTVYADQKAACGFLPQSDQFACDIFIYDELQNELTLGIRSFEHIIEGPWSFEWRPISLSETSTATRSQTVSLSSEQSLGDYFKKADEELQPVISSMLELSAGLSSSAGWVMQKIESESAIANEDFPELISHPQKDIQLTHVIQESWDQIREDGTAGANITLARDVTSGKLISGTWSDNGIQIILPQGLLFNNSRAGSIYAAPYIYGSSFFSLIDSDATLLDKFDCEYNSTKTECYTFKQSLIADSAETTFPHHELTFWIDNEGEILHSETYCDLNGDGNQLCVQQSLKQLSYQESLSAELQALIESYIF